MTLPPHIASPDKWQVAGLCAICLVHASVALAAPDEIEVYTDEMVAPGKFGFEQNLNYTLQGTQAQAYPGQMVTHHVVQATSGLSYGITKNLEVGGYVPVAFSPDGNVFVNALRLRLKYIDHPSGGENLFYGASIEVSRESVRTSESSLGAEVRPIIGYRGATWLASFNPALSVALADNVSHQAQFQPALKLTHRVDEDVFAGIEYYGEYGALNNLPPSDQRAHTMYAVCDVEARGYDVNFGIGKGYAAASDAWVIKAVITSQL